MHTHEWKALHICKNSRAVSYITLLSFALDWILIQQFQKDVPNLMRFYFVSVFFICAPGTSTEFTYTLSPQRGAHRHTPHWSANDILFLILFDLKQNGKNVQQPLLPRRTKNSNRKNNDRLRRLVSVND